MRAKTLFVLIAVGAVFAMLPRAARNRATSRHAEPDADIVLRPVPRAISNEPRFDARDEPFALLHRPEAGWNMQEAQAGSGDFPGTVEHSEDARGYSDEEAIWGDELPEDPSVYAMDPSDHFWARRRIFSDEAPDATWSEQLRAHLTGGLTATRRHTISLHEIDCRETMCQLYVRTNTAIDAQAIFAAMREGGMDLESQELAGHVQLEAAPKGGVIHELVVQRERPATFEPHVKGAARAQREAAEASEGIQ